MTVSQDTIGEPRHRLVDGLSVRYAWSEPAEEHALLLCPWPESLYAYAPTWAPLAERAHLVAVDLPGFGHPELALLLGARGDDDGAIRDRPL